MWRYNLSSTTPLLGLGAAAFSLYYSPLDTTHLTLTHAILFAVTVILLQGVRMIGELLDVARAAQHDVHALLDLARADSKRGEEREAAEAAAKAKPNLLSLLNSTMQQLADPRRPPGSPNSRARTPFEGDGDDDGDGGSTGPSRPPSLSNAERPLEVSAAQFRDALLGSDDVAVPRFMRACRAYADCVLQRMGPFTLLSIREVHSNMRKVQLTHDIDPSTLGTMRAILQREIAGAMHQPGGLIADPSAAMGLLWARRGLAFWVHFYRACEAHEASGEEAQSFAIQRAVTAAYEAELQPHNGWVTRHSFALATRTAGEWDAIRAKLAPTDTALRDDLQSWLRAVVPLLERMGALQKALDLEDTRKSI